MVTSRVDLHVKVLDDGVVERAKARGLDVLVYAPHFQRLSEVRETAEVYSDEELLIVPAREVFTGNWRNRRHVLAVDPDEPIPDFITFDGAMNCLASDTAAILAPHPGFLTVSCSRTDIRSNIDIFDALETYNPKHLAHHNTRASAMANTLGVPAYGSSYAHRRATVGEVWTTFERPIESGADLVEALQNGAERTVEQRHGATHRARCLAEFAHLGWENSWEKIDRVLLSGMEATHPDHVAYNGEFADVAVY